MTYIKTGEVSFTTQSSVSIDNCFSAAYTHYLVVRNLLHSAGDVALNVRLRVASTDASGADYRRQYVEASSTSVTGGRATAQTSWPNGFGYGEATAIGFGILRISNPFDTVRTTAWSDSGNGQSGSIELRRNVYAHDPTTSYDGITVYPTSGTITGSIKVYGLKAS